MRIIVTFGLFLLFPFFVSGCVSGADAVFTTQVDASKITPSETAAEQLQSNVLRYSDCLTNGIVEATKKASSEGTLPLFYTTPYEEKCADLERQLYQSFYSSAFKDDPDAPQQVWYEEGRHNTARNGVEKVKSFTFKTFYDGFSEGN